MKKLIIAILMLVLVFSSAVNLSIVHAATSENQVIQAPELQSGNVFTFEQLGYSEKLLVGPFDSSSIYFSVPANVRLSEGSLIMLNYGLAWSGSPEATADIGVAGTLLVYFNDELIDTIVLNGAGDTSKEILIPAEALNAVDSDGRYQLRVFLNADINCRFDNVHTTLILSKNSFFGFQYEDVAPTVDLSLLPRPIFQRDSIFPNTAVIVVPDNPDISELQSALTVSAGLGSITDGELKTSLITNSSLTTELVSSNHLIFVGLAKNFPNLQSAKLPYPIGSNGLSLPLDHNEDGIIQIGQSPWSESKVVLYVGGNLPEAVVKASQAFSTGDIIAVEEPDVSFVSAVSTQGRDDVVLVDRTLKDLGYDSQTMGLFGESYISYTFYSSPEQANSTGAYFDLVITHSDLLDYESTGVTVILNDDVIGGVRLEKESPTTTRIKLVPDVLRRGVNRLEVFSDIVPYYTCYSTDLLSTWVTISETSVIHLPVSEEKLDIGSNANLRDYPYMLLSSTSLGDLAFVLPIDDQISWATAANAAFYIGAKGNLPVVNLHTAYADDVSDDILNNYNLVAIGQSSTLPFLSQINDDLPAPFPAGSDEAVQPSMTVNYSLLPDTSVGYLQLLPSPWNSEKVVLAILGNTQDGIPMAGATLIRDELASKLAGNFAIMYGDQVLTTDTRLGISKEGLISGLSVAVTVTPSSVVVSPTQVQSQVVKERPVWILPLIVIITLLIVGFLTFVFYRGYGKNKSSSNDVTKNLK